MIDPEPPRSNPPPDSAGKVTPLPPATEGAKSDANPANQLTPEEQMALFEKELKENDWGHQPC